MSKIQKGAFFTDIHFGRRNSDVVHNQDCADFIDWFCDQVRNDKSITYIGFLGDFFETRATINIHTLTMAYGALKKLNALGLPIYFVVGNHDLFRRSTREIFSTEVFGEFTNIQIVNEPIAIDDKILFSPYLFPNEYPSLSQYDHIPVWAGHFEFRGFMITGYNLVMEHGPDHKLFKNQKHIFSGHFHKRQAKDNVIFMGNCFPMDFGDAGDTNRGMMTYDHNSDDVEFFDWIGPTYVKTTLSKALADDWVLKPNDRMRVICTNDIELSYSEAQMVKETLKDTYQFREFRLEENHTERKDALENDVSDDEINEAMSIDEIVISSLSDISEIKSISNAKLVELYKQL
jgi:DNA repair exonuclease SbcCD nuclease subunit